MNQCSHFENAAVVTGSSAGCEDSEKIGGLWVRPSVHLFIERHLRMTSRQLMRRLREKR